MNNETRPMGGADPGAGYSEPDAGAADMAREAARAGETHTDAPRRRTRRRLRRFLLVLGPVAVALAGGYLYLTGGRYVSTEDAYVKADMVTISAEVAGPIAEVLVGENEHVAKGAPLFRIDDRSYRVALARADAAARAAREDVAGLKASYEEKLAELGLAQSNADLGQRAYLRERTLNRQKFASQAQLDDARRTRDIARQQVTVVKQELAQVAASLGGKPDAPVEQQPRYLEAKAARDQAALDLRRTVVRAPFAGIASNVPKPGLHVAPGTPVMSVVADTGLWVEANFKEDELTYVRPGQPVTVRVDTYPDHVWHGTVASIAQATGAEFSVLPPQNATGNWVKVVQRIAVRIRLADERGGPQLRTGMSATVDIDTGHRRAFLSALASLFGTAKGTRTALR